MADRRRRQHHVITLEYTFDRLLARKLEQAYAILVPDRVRRAVETGQRAGPHCRHRRWSGTFSLAPRPQGPANASGARLCTGPPGDAFASQLQPDFARPIDLEVLLVRPSDLLR